MHDATGFIGYLSYFSKLLSSHAEGNIRQKSVQPRWSMISREEEEKRKNDLVLLIPLILNNWFKLLNFGCVFVRLGSLYWKEVTL